MDLRDFGKGIEKDVEQGFEKLASELKKHPDSGQSEAQSSPSLAAPAASQSPASTAPAASPGTPEPLAPTPGALGRTLLIHGYSANGKDLIPWRQKLLEAGVSTVAIEIGNYITLDNEITIKDLGEAFDRALRKTPWSTGTRDDNWTFDAVVHSTGMLVLRQWLASDPYDRNDSRSRIRRLKHLIGLAPATFGSPQAKEGRSWLGALFKGNRHFGPDFLNAGNLVLDGLELGSRYTWELTHKDMFCPKPLFDKSPNTPYVTIFIGNTIYDGPAALVSPPGSDGTVRWAGCSLNARKVVVDFRREPRLHDVNGNLLKGTRFYFTPPVEGRLDSPMIAVEGKNHGTIISDPDPNLVAFIKKFLAVSSADEFEAWSKEADDFGKDARSVMDEKSTIDGSEGAGWQQLVVHVVDDHGDGVTDYNLQLYIGKALTDSDLDKNNPDKDPIHPVPLIADTYSGDASYRCFYVRLSKDMLNLNTPEGKEQKMWLELIASSGSDFIQYEAYRGQPDDPHPLTIDHNGGSPVKLDITPLAQGKDTLLFPYTTTLLEIFVEREPVPLGTVSKLFNFLGYEKQAENGAAQPDSNSG